MKKVMKIKAKAFTLVEMLMVLIIISVLLLLFVPNMSKQKEAVQEKGGEAVVKVVEGQAELYEIRHDEKATITSLVEEGAITVKQSQAYQEYYAKHTDRQPAVMP